MLSGVVATNRFGLGAASGELTEANKEPLGWLASKLVPIAFNDDLPSSQDVMRAGQAYRDEKKRSKENKSSPPKSKYAQDTFLSLSTNTLERAIDSKHSVSWRLLDFFSNHFSVTANGRVMRGLAVTLEREAIAPHLLGDFSEMLIAVTQHPAMLLYLNNEKSYGPHSRLGIKRKKGLNENLAREILELHTLGVNGGYQQIDVIELAKGITGWSLANFKRDKKFGFSFKPSGHEPGTRTLLGKSYSQKGVKQGEAMLRSLAKHPNTAHFICYKLAHHFISDSPSETLVNRLVQTWQDTQGNLKSVLLRLFNEPEAWEEKRHKYKTPREYLISVYRGMGNIPISAKRLSRDLTQLGQKPFNAGSPAGYSDNKQDWEGSSALMARIDWVSALIKQYPRNAEDIMRDTLGNEVSERTYNMVLRAGSRELSLALLLLSPEFLRR